MIEREKSLSFREKSINEREQNLNERDKSLNERDKSLNERAKQLKETETQDESEKIRVQDIISTLEKLSTTASMASGTISIEHPLDTLRRKRLSNDRPSPQETQIHNASIYSPRPRSFDSVRYISQPCDFHGAVLQQHGDQ